MTREQIIAALDAAPAGSVALGGEYTGTCWEKDARYGWTTNDGRGSGDSSTSLAMTETITHIIPAVALAQFAVEEEE